eukprot:GGOE01021016.1.p4 GENE.GGOE01021016.1~~GGOE01021016.1.p4  ORF type:complete len:146 (-),score=23.43 GGOE01021016.1:394-831(-)
MKSYASPQPTLIHVVPGPWRRQTGNCSAAPWSHSNGPQPKSMSRPVTQGTAAAHRHPARSASPTATTLRSRRAGPRRVLQVGDWQVETAETNWDPPAHGYVLAAACTQVRGRPGHHQSRLNEALQFVHAMLDAVEIGSPPKARPR